MKSYSSSSAQPTGLQDELRTTMASSILVGKLLSKNPNLGQVQTQRPNDSLYDAARNMAAKNIGSALVTTGINRKVLGIVTERDYMKFTLERGDAKNINLQDVMTPVEKISFVEKK